MVAAAAATNKHQPYCTEIKANNLMTPNAQAKENACIFTNRMQIGVPDQWKRYYITDLMKLVSMFSYVKWD